MPIKPSIKAGDVFNTNNCGTVTVVEYIKSNNVVVRFSDGTEINARADHLRAGCVENPQKPVVCGIGYMGVGEHSSKACGRKTRVYNTWVNMLKRCYDEGVQRRHPTYRDCTVCEEWHNFQNFANWFALQMCNNQDWQLDKDLSVVGNKVYSPEACCLIPRQVNSLLNDCRAVRGEFPQGVHLHVPTGKFCARTTINGKRKHLGMFYTSEEAFYVYKHNKEMHVREMAEEYRDDLPDEVYQNMLKYTVLITD